jgi:exopolysaccharide production protein ExoQ
VAVERASPAAASAMAAAVALGVALPLLLVPATKSSALSLSVAAAFSVVAAIAGGAWRHIAGSAVRAALSPLGITALLLLAFMAASIPFAHAPGASAGQYLQFTVVIAAGAVLGIAFPAVAPRRRAFLFALGANLTAVLIYADLKTGLWLRTMTGGRVQTFTYNRGLVTLTVLIWPLLALIVASRKLWLIPPLAIALPLAVSTGDSGTAVVALAAGIAVFPVAALLPRLTLITGLGGALLLLAVQPWIGSLMKLLLGQSFHQRFSGAHSGERVDIWLSFEAAVKAKWLFGSGFASSLNMQDAPVAAFVPPERVTMLGASHPHNAFLQIWVELGLVGASIAAVLIALVFRAIAGMRPGLQPFALTCMAVVMLVALVSHGAWQAWWAAILAAVAAFATLEAELRRSEPPL